MEPIDLARHDGKRAATHQVPELLWAREQACLLDQRTRPSGRPLHVGLCDAMRPVADRLGVQQPSHWYVFYFEL